MNESLAREEICRLGRSLFERGLVHASAGNISIQLDGADPGFLITPTDACLGFLEPDRIARLNPAGEQLSGDRASKTIALHRRIYAASAGTAAAAGCIIHTHSTHCVALTLAQHHQQGLQPELVQALTPYFVMKVGRVPVIEYAVPGDVETARRVEQAIARYSQHRTPIRAVMLERLGPTVWHETGAAAMAVLEELEETAKLAVLTQGKNIVPLEEAQIDALRTTFGAHW